MLYLYQRRVLVIFHFFYVYVDTVSLHKIYLGSIREKSCIVTVEI